MNTQARKMTLEAVCALFCVICLLMLACSCSTLGNGKIDNPLAITPYEAGRIFVFMDVVTQPIQPDEVKLAVSQVYALAEISVSSDVADFVVKEEINRLYPAATPEFKAVLFNLYDKLTIRLLSQVGANPDLPQVEVFTQFQKGINDAVALYKAP